MEIQDLCSLFFTGGSLFQLLHAKQIEIQAQIDQTQNSCMLCFNGEWRELDRGDKATDDYVEVLDFIQLIILYLL